MNMVFVMAAKDYAINKCDAVTLLTIFHFSILLIFGQEKGVRV